MQGELYEFGKRPTTKLGLMKLSNDRLESLQLLYDNDFFDIVISDFGYPIEFGLKAAICARNYIQEYPKDHKYFQHKAHKLIELCGLTDELNSMLDDEEFFTAWSYISSWDVCLRYTPTGDGAQRLACACIKSLTKGGFFEWIKENWEEKNWIEKSL